MGSKGLAETKKHQAEEHLEASSRSDGSRASISSSGGSLHCMAVGAKGCWASANGQLPWLRMPAFAGTNSILQEQLTPPAWGSPAFGSRPQPAGQG